MIDRTLPPGTRAAKGEIDVGFAAAMGCWDAASF
jgi:hypothetical protein